MLCTYPQVELPPLHLLLVHPLLRVFLPLLQVILPQREQLLDEKIGKLLDETFWRVKGSSAVPIAEERLDQEESLDDQASRVERRNIVCVPSVNAMLATFSTENAPETLFRTSATAPSTIW